MSILDHNQQYEVPKENTANQDFGKCFWFCGSMRLHRNRTEVKIVEDEISVHEQQTDSDNQIGTYFKLNGSFAESDLSNPDDDDNNDYDIDASKVQENGYSENDSGDGMWFGLSGRMRRAESFENLLQDNDKNVSDQQFAYNDELDNIDAQFKAIEQLVLDSFEQIDFGESKDSKAIDEIEFMEKTNGIENLDGEGKHSFDRVNIFIPDVTSMDFQTPLNEETCDTKKVEKVEEESIVQKVVKDNFAIDNFDFAISDMNGSSMIEEEDMEKEKKSPTKKQTPRVLQKRLVNAADQDSNDDYDTSEDEGNRNFKRGTSFRRSIVIEDEVENREKRKKSTGGTCVSVAFMAVNASTQDESSKKSTNQQLKGILNFLENMVIDEESLYLYYDAVRTLHTMYWDLKGVKKEDNPSESLSTVLNFLVVHEWPKVMLTCFKKLKSSYPHVFMEEPDAESTIYYSGHLPSLLRMNRTTSEFAVAVIFDGLLKAAVNFTDVHEASRQACCEDSLLSYLLQDIMPQLYNIKWGKATAREMFLKSICDLIYNCAQSYSNAPYMLEHNCVDILTAMRDQTFHVVDARKVNMAMLLSLSYLIDDNNYEMILPSEEFVIRLLQFLDRSLEHSEHTYHDFYAAELVDCLARLASHSEIQAMITRNSGQEILHKLLKYAYDDEERISACNALWNLTFCHKAKDILRGMTKLMNHLRELITSSNYALHRAASGVIWECEGKYDLQGKRKAQDTTPQHVMISYEIEAQPLVIGIRDELNRQGYQVWMTTENEDRSLLDSMNRGVELASVVVVAVTRKYKLTPNTFAEIDYANKLRKTIVPVIVDVDFVPDGWLKQVIETEKTFDFSRRSMFGGSLDALMEHIKSLISPQTLNLPSLNTERARGGESGDVLSWNNSDVIYWLKENQLIKSVNNVGRLNKLTGLHLLMFFDLKKESPDYYYSVLDSHLGFKDVLDTLEFTYAIDRLLGRERLI